MNCWRSSRKGAAPGTSSSGSKCRVLIKLLDVLHLVPGAKVGLAVDNGRLVVEPLARPRYTLAELLAQAEAAGVYPLPPDEREWIDAPAAGKELI